MNNPWADLKGEPTCNASRFREAKVDSGHPLSSGEGRTGAKSALVRSKIKTFEKNQGLFYLSKMSIVACFFLGERGVNF